MRRPILDQKNLQVDSDQEVRHGIVPLCMTKLNSNEIYHQGHSSRLISVDSPRSLSIIFFENLVKRYNVLSPLNHKIIDENLQANDKFEFLRDITSTDSQFKEQIQDLNQTSLIHLKENISSLLVRSSQSRVHHIAKIIERSCRPNPNRQSHLCLP